MLMKIKRSTEVENMYLPEFKTFKKKRSIEKGRLSIFIIGWFFTPFLFLKGLLTFEYFALKNFFAFSRHNRLFFNLMDILTQISQYKKGLKLQWSFRGSHTFF